MTSYEKYVPCLRCKWKGPEEILVKHITEVHCLNIDDYSNSTKETNIPNCSECQYPSYLEKKHWENCSQYKGCNCFIDKYGRTWHYTICHLFKLKPNCFYCDTQYFACHHDKCPLKIYGEIYD